jgi:hypothetical protein
MSKNESQQEATEQFSFIYTLTYSRSVVSQREQLKDNSPRPRVPASPRQSLVANSNQNEIASSIIPSSVISPIILDFEQLERSLSFLTPDFPIEQKQPVNSQPNNRGINAYLDKIFFFVAFGYLFFVIWWLVEGQNGKIPLFSWLKHHSEQQLSKSDANFLDYMERSLAVIDRKTEATQQQSTTDNSLTNELASQIVYVPVYNAITAMAPSPISTVPPPPPMPVTSKPVPLPEAITATTKPELPPPPPEPVSSPSPTNSVNSSVADYTLVGLLELGEKSAALFTVDGTTQRIWLGEKIDNTGWTLEAIANQKAQIRNQQQVRSLSIGEQF